MARATHGISALPAQHQHTFQLRYVELSLLAIVGVLLFIGLEGYDLGVTGHLARTGVQVSLAGTALSLGVSVFLSWRAPDADELIFPLVALLSGLSILMLQRLAPSFASRQLLWIGVGTVVMLLAASSHRYLQLAQRYKYTAAFLGFLLIVGTIVHGVDINGSGYRRWFGFGGIYFQPVEVLKILIVIFFAAYLDEHREVLRSASLTVGRVQLPPFQYLAPMLVMWVISLLLLVVQNDLGSALLFFGIFLAIMYVGAPRAIYTGIGASIFAVGVLLAYRVFPHVRDRAALWLDPWSHASGQGYQIVQGLIALASGGILGSGLGLGDPGVVPAVRTDFIFTAIGEEWGLVGGVLILMCYVALIFRGLRIGMLGSSLYESLLAVGVTATLAIQTFVILGGDLRVIPLTGVTLPFISYGGSSILANYLIIGLLLRLSATDRSGS